MRSGTLCGGLSLLQCLALLRSFVLNVSWCICTTNLFGGRESQQQPGAFNCCDSAGPLSLVIVVRRYKGLSTLCSVLGTSSCLPMSQHNYKILSWNVRGLNEVARRDSVQELVRDTGSTIVCLQETKLTIVDDATILRTLCPNFLNNIAVLPAIGSRGGILLAASNDFFSLSQVYTTSHTVSAMITMKADNSAWWITGVYGPQSSAEKLVFLQELSGLAAQRWTKWLALGDFNLIYQASDKNNCNLNRRLMGAFKSALDSLQMKEIHLNGRRYTWSNGQANPTLTRIDRFFCTTEWELLFPSCYLHSLPSLMSDHTPLLL
jgi:exonuclease III